MSLVTLSRKVTPSAFPENPPAPRKAFTIEDMIWLAGYENEARRKGRKVEIPDRAEPAKLPPPRWQAIIAFVKENPISSGQEIAEALGIPRPSTERYLRQLVDEGKLQRGRGYMRAGKVLDEKLRYFTPDDRPKAGRPSGVAGTILDLVAKRPGIVPVQAAEALGWNMRKTGDVLLRHYRAGDFRREKTVHENSATFAYFPAGDE